MLNALCSVCSLGGSINQTSIPLNDYQPRCHKIHKTHEYMYNKNTKSAWQSNLKSRILGKKYPKREVFEVIHVNTNELLETILGLIIQSWVVRKNFN